jgi:hypothetical protein
MPTVGTTRGSPSNSWRTAIAVFALDLRGRGQVRRERFYVEKFEDYVSDVAGFVALAKSREPGLPVFLLGRCAPSCGAMKEAFA